MTSNISKNFPGGMRIGNTITASIQLFRSHFQKYYLTTLKATLWFLVPELASKLISVFFRPPQSSLLIIATALILLYFRANYFAGASVVFRMAFNELISRTEDEKQIQSAIFSKKWSLIWVNLPGLFMVLGFAVLICILFAVGAGFIESQGSIPNPVLFLIAASIVLIFAFLGFFWALTRYSVAYLLLILEDIPSTSQALKRSWAITKGSVLRLQAIYSLSLLVSAPVIGLDTLITSLIRNYISQPWIAIPLGLLESLLISPVYVVFLGIVGVFAYVDLINRREGADLTLLPDPTSIAK
jgi:hypothetical protein